MTRPSAKPTAPPQELSDPLREFRPLFLALAVLAGVHVLRVWQLFDSPPQFTGYTPAGLIELLVGNAFGFATAATLYGLSPRRAAAAIYLRAFRNDARTGLLRIDLQVALGRTLRLAGIRDPRRRSSAWVRYFLSGLFAVRYSLPKYMNLEAGRDWKARLWASLGEARCAVIDISDATPFVRDEVGLAVPRLGLHRTLFVSDGALDSDECRRVTLDLLGTPDVPPEHVRVAVWSGTAAGRAAFIGAVREFAANLPQGPLGDDEPPPPETVPPVRTPMHAAAVARMAFEVVPLVVVIAGSAHYAVAYTDPAVANFYAMAVHVVLAATGAVFVVQMAHYLYACGSTRERLRFAAVFLASLLLAAYPLVRRIVQSDPGLRPW